MSARDTGDDTGDTDAVQDLVDGMPEFANETADMIRDVLAERDATTAEADIVTLADVDMTADEMETIAAETKAWVPYRGTRGGQGWRNTITQRVVYEDEPPATDDDVDIDEIDMDDVMDVQISSLPVMDELDARDAMVGRPVEVQTENDRLVDGEITAVDPDSIEVTDERGTDRTYDISGTDVDGEVYMEYPTFYASGVAGTEQSLLPDEGEPNGPQLAAEALRRAAEIDSYYETDKLEEFVGEARSRGVDEERVEAAVELAIDTHPGLHDTEYDDIMGQETTQVGDMTGESLYAHLDDVTVSRAEMHEITNTDPAWDHVSVMGGVGWHNTATDEVIYASTPEGVPDNYVYVPPDEEVGDEYDTVTSPQGATYRSPSPTDDTDDDTGAATDPDPEEDIDRLRESETATEVITQANDEPFGGFTFQRNLEVQALGERDEWAVGLGLGPGRQQEEMDKDDIQEVYEEHLELLEDFTGLRIGGYHFGDNEGGYEIEVSVTVNDADEAEALGEELNQDSVFNLGTEELIMTGGDGDSPIESIDDARDVLETIDSITEMAFSVVTDSADEIDSMAAQTEMDTTTVYANDAGDELTFAQIARAAAKQPELEVEEAGDGDSYIFDGELYTPVADEDGGEE